MPGTLRWAQQPPLASGRALRELTVKRATTDALLELARALLGAQIAAGAHRSPRQSGRP